MARPGAAVVADALTTGGFRAGWLLVRRLPERTAYRLFDTVAVLVHRRGGPSVQRLRSNYARVRPEATDAELDTLTRAGVQSYLRYWCDAFRLPDLTQDQIRARVRVIGDQPVRERFAAGQPCVAFLGHLGNWDMAGAWATVDLAPVVTVAERLKPESVYAEFLAFREGLGMRILPLTGGGDVFAQLRSALTGPVLVPLLADRDLTQRGLAVRLLGQQASVAVGPAALAVATKAALFPVSIWYEPAPELGSRWRTVIEFGDQVADPGTGTTRERVHQMTQRCADVLSAGIEAHLEDWHMMQRVFDADLPARDPGSQPRAQDP